MYVYDKCQQGQAVRGSRRLWCERKAIIVGIQSSYMIGGNTMKTLKKTTIGVAMSELFVFSVLASVSAN